MANLFTTQTPSVTDASDGSPGITTATTVRFTVAGTVTGIRFYATTTVGGTYTVLLYQVTAADTSPAGTLLASKTMGAAPTGGTWNTVTLDTPISVATGTLYRACLFSGAGRYVATTAFFTSALVNGSIVGDSNGDNPVGLGTLNQGTFAINASATYPSTVASAASYFVDVEFTADTGDKTTAPAGLAVPVSLGSPVASFAGSVSPSGLAVPVSLGSPTASFAGSVSPAGLAVPVSLGAPTLPLATAVPAGIGIPVSLGAPTVPATEAASAVGSWDGYLDALRAARVDAKLNEQRRRHPVECPYDGWPLQPHGNVFHCQFGGHIITPSI